MKFQILLGLAVLLALCTAQDSSKNGSDECIPGEMFQDDNCNNCICPRNGKKEFAACHLMFCPEEKQRMNDTCEPGTAFTIDCMDCICPDTGIQYGAACTLPICP